MSVGGRESARNREREIYRARAHGRERGGKKDRDRGRVVAKFELVFHVEAYDSYTHVPAPLNPTP